MFHRRSGHCNTHYIQKSYILKNDDIEERDLKAALTILKMSSADLIFGDLIVFESVSGYRNEGVAIFDGNKIVRLYYDVDDYGSLPKKFQVIKDDVPIDYWKDLDNQRGIKHNDIVWFDHKIVRDQCLKNLKYQKNSDNKYVIHTYFIYNSKTYYIIFEYVDFLQENDIHYDEETYRISDETVILICNKCISLLKSDAFIVFENESKTDAYYPSDNKLFTVL